MIKKHAGKETYDKFVVFFGWCVAGVQFLAAGLLMLTDLPYIDKASHAFIPMVVGMIILTLIANNKKKDGQE